MPSCTLLPTAEVARRSARERKGNAKYAAGAAAGGDEPEATAKGERGKRQLRPEAVEDSSDEEQQEEEVGGWAGLTR